MTSNEKNRGLYGFFDDFKLRRTFQEQQHSARRWRHLAYIVLYVSCWIDELRFVRSEPSNMHRCRVFPFALAGLFLFFFRARCFEWCSLLLVITEFDQTRPTSHNISCQNWDHGRRGIRQILNTCNFNTTLVLKLILSSEHNPGTNF